MVLLFVKQWEPQLLLVYHLELDLLLVLVKVWVKVSSAT
jgi:hypothetical protein